MKALSGGGGRGGPALVVKTTRIYNCMYPYGGYTTRSRRLYNKGQEVMYSKAIIEPLQKTFAYIRSPRNFVLFSFLHILPY